jgi:hypothetical protein
MTAVVVILVLLALVIGGLFITGLKWLLIIAGVLLLLSLISGAFGARGSRV